MKTSEIVVGGVYEGKNGQHRKVIAARPMYNGLAYRVVKRGKWRGFVVGHQDNTNIISFASWAVKTVAPYKLEPLARPCDTCNVNIRQALDHDSIECFESADCWAKYWEEK